MAKTITLDYTPTPKQALFHKSNADELLYGGAAGGGKSKACVMEALILCLEHPKTHAYLFRRSYPELRDTLIAEALRSIPSALGKFSGAKYDFTLKNGSVLHFRYCGGMTDVTRYQGVEIHWLFIDELTHFEKGVYDYLKTRLRAPNTLGIKPRVRCTSNPGGVGHGWVKAYFIDSIEPFVLNKRTVFSPLLGREDTKTVQYIPAYATDNPHISDDYIFELEQKPEKLRKALLLGNWDAFEGQVFTEWTDDPQKYSTGKYTHVITPFDIPKSWQRYRSFDFGFSKPFSVGWWAADNDGRLYRYREYYGCTGTPNEGIKISPREIAQNIAAIERQHGESNVIGIADPSIFEESRGESIAMQMEAEGVYFTKGDNTRLAGKMQVHLRLRFDEDGIPMMYVFNNCRHFLRTMPNLVYSAKNPEDINTDCEDHIYDETRYMLMDHPISRERKKVDYVIKEYDPLSD